MKHRNLLLALAAALVAVPAFASGTSGTSGGSLGAPSAERPFAVTETLKCKILEVTEQGRVLRVFDEKTATEQVLKVGPSVEIKAQDKRAFDGRKELFARDFAVGQRIKVTYRADNMELMQVKVLKAKS